MRKLKVARLLVCSFVFAGMLPAQIPAKVDFAKDVLPILRQNCVGCHGPSQQTSGFRVDRKSVVMGRRGVVPGSSDNSFLYHRISGNAYGMQMPPTGALRPEQIDIIKAWIDQAPTGRIRSPTKWTARRSIPRRWQWSKRCAQWRPARAS
jgi:mono/diheme cytochrome c family protein